MDNNPGSDWQLSVGQHLAEWEERGNKSIFDRLEQGPPAYNSSLPYIPPYNRLSINDDFVQHNNSSSVFDRLVRPQNLNRNPKKTAKLNKAHQWRMRIDARNEKAANQVVVTGAVLDAITALSKAPANTTDWDAVIQEALDGAKITQEEIDQKELVLGLIEQTLKAKFPGAICRLLGSSDTKLCFKESDADINVSLGHDPYDNTTKKEGKSRAAKLTRQLGSCFKGHAEFRVERLILHSRVPLAKLYHKTSKTRVDLSFRNAFGVSNSTLLQLLCDSHPLVRPFILFLRLWATAHNISGSGQPTVLLSNYTLTLLALFTCIVRKQRLVPSLGDLRKQSFDSNMIDGWECGYGTDVTAYWQQQEKKGPPTSVDGGVLALAVEFFELFAGLDYLRWVVCPLVGSLVARDALHVTADAAPAVDTEGTDSDWGETDYEAPTDIVNDITAMITDTDDAMITDTVETGVAIATDVVATAAAAPINTSVTDAVVTTKENIAIKTDTGANCSADTNDTAMEVPVNVNDAENCSVSSGHVTEVINHATTNDPTTDAAAAAHATTNDPTTASAHATTNDPITAAAAAAHATTNDPTTAAAHATTNDPITAAAAAANHVTGPATDPAAGGGKMKNMDPKKFPFCVIDVFALDTNITSQYCLQSLIAFQRKCRISANILREVMKQEKPLSALFSKLEDTQ